MFSLLFHLQKSLKTPPLSHKLIIFNASVSLIVD
ncbi:hypothetical protein HD_0664 [[Haemophilus] ducreyi 35000HP]|uniref:Uncharacterized protein n=1 Tax=Haemophilus ducreyi (strain 35000HP / ATCC 700724) TaxID=233412 RepID=Q7VN97_HAEDU|nr:hypothetical protein HD_0664 [[Haemophilus] ducreyi 35000HP]